MSNINIHSHFTALMCAVITSHHLTVTPAVGSLGCRVLLCRQSLGTTHSLSQLLHRHTLSLLRPTHETCRLPRSQLAADHSFGLELDAAVSCTLLQAAAYCAPTG